MGTSFGWALGERLGWLYNYYVLGLLLGCAGVHTLLLVGYQWLSTRRVEKSRLVAVELLYGLLNPVVYLLIFQPALFRSVSPAWLTALSWALLLGFWGLRLLGPLLPLRRDALRRPVRVLLLACLALIGAVGLRDFIASVRTFYSENDSPWQWLMLLFVSPLYAFPMLIAWRLRRKTLSAEAWADGGSFFFLSRFARGLGWATVLATVLLGITALWRPSEHGTRELLLAHRDDIRAASAKAGLDPRLLASILFVTHREHTTPFRAGVEETAAAAWLADPASHMLISKALDPSLGLAQVKPVTVLTALAIHYVSGGGGRYLPSKQYREVPDAGDAWKRIPTPGLVRVPRPALSVTAGKEEVVRALLDPKRNLELSAFLLNLYATQWEEARPEWSIRTRPDILATLYQIGFQRSHPKPDPRPNEFGTRVSEVFNEPWMREHFGP